ncbi:MULTISPECIES: sensor histidine kinase [Streptomycetaceae]|uniref:histidine kinase n=1 Tax=Streptantibioticus cattleyicolor (strain ATCC 35852 / DSM 46488 / JCM 4925 / NBRC 14057 / NRRL 8057) TaxID=1003195 RepID=F8JXI2_STREN|nr:MULTISPECIES: sensor histidine kinase [Streptomycetaceae]AEW95867.1 two-component system sensor kinase [Streptantibioticus cattleyicolor NRRL 8057 = DSM 46488]MYS60408.1 sensor histidine kinase [Streptomyces sp. SID5468]CCB76203.1 putative two-component system sensor kinase [Streptantibioticus cattleyicolor NRRL 8057 = DSM 46488]
MATALTDPRPHQRRLPAALRAPVEARTWRELLHLLLNLPMGIVGFCYMVTMTTLGAGLLVTFLGVPVLAAMLAGCRGIGVLERLRARTLLRAEVAEPEPVRRRPGGLMAWVGGLFRSGASWRHALYCLLRLPWGVFTFTVATVWTTVCWSMLSYPLWRWVFPAYVDQPGIQLYGDGRGHAVYLSGSAELAATAAVGLLLTLAWPWVVRGLASVEALLVRGLLGPSERVSRVRELESDRGVVVDTAAADLRRIERALHDGAQARLVALAMELGQAKEVVRDDPRAAVRLVESAHGEVKTALQELRDLARGIHPAILTDRGLGPALSAVAARCPVPVTVAVDLPARPAPAIEGIAYFTVSELLDNVGRHSGARTAGVEVWRSGDRMLVQVTDDGHGGARPGAGAGLAGLAARLDSMDGVLTVDSPAGGPTRITAELPWRS